MSIIITTAIPGSGMTYTRENKQWDSYMKKCGQKTEVYSRVCGYFRPVQNWNRGKKQEFKDRKNYEVGAGVSEIYPLESSPVSTFQKR